MVYKVLIQQINCLDKMVKVTFLIAVVLLFLCTSTTAWLDGEGRGSSSNNNNGGYGGSHNENRGGGREKDTSYVDVGRTKDGAVEVRGSITHEKGGVSVGAEATANSRGEYGVGAKISIKFRKRNTVLNGRHYTVKLDPCSFGVYDVNKDGVIVKSEMVAIFGENTKAEELFEALDLTTGDGRIEEKEFYFMSAVTIDGCQI